MKEVKEKESVDMFVQLAVFQEGAFLITIRLWEGPPARPGEFFLFYFFSRALFAVSMLVYFLAEDGLIGSQTQLFWHGLKLVGSFWWDD